ncbi:MAG: hypothetical protein OEU32_13850 [Acidimicrobiia bacterium]|nr:hypothetical protein [Acidimicrobiia bacterium]
MNDDGVNDDGPTLEELMPVGGSWRGLLFENASAGHTLALTWTFTIDFEEIAREYGSVAPNLVVDWVPLTPTSWRSVSGHEIECDRFGQPIETSFYFFEHHRYDNVSLSTGNQSGGKLIVSIRASGDLDGLGLAAVTFDGELDFDGIIVQTESSGTDTDAAVDLLARFTDTAGLSAAPTGHNVIFTLDRQSGG